MIASPYGFWNSPITSDLVVADSIRLEQVALDGDATPKFTHRFAVWPTKARRSW